MTLNSKTNSRKNTTTVSVDDVVLNGVLAVLDRKQNKWVGTMTEVGNAITDVVGKSVRKNLPGSPGALRVVLNRIVQRLRSRGVSVKFGRTTDHTRTRFVRFAR